MTQNYRSGLVYVLIGAFLLLVSAFLTLAIDQARRLISLYRVTAIPSSGTGLSKLQSLSRSFGNDVLTLAIVAAVLFVFVFRKPRRLLPVSITAALVFVILNLYSGRHLLPQVLVWPSPVSLLERYTQALASNDLEAALSLTDGSERCETIMMQIFEDDQALMKRRLGDDWHESGIQATPVMRITTFYDKPPPQGLVIMQPVPQQLFSTMAETEKGGTIWLSFKMSYGPYVGARYICGRDVDSS